MTEQADFSLAGGGLLAALLERWGLARRVLLRVTIISAAAWLPLLVISATEGLAVGPHVRIPFLGDYGVYGRLLVAVPVLLLGEVVVGSRTRAVLRQFTTSGLVRDQDLTPFESAVMTAARRKESAIPEVVILGVIYAVTLSRVHLVMSDSLTTWYGRDGSITAAGWYYALVSLPLFQFLLLRWLWRIVIWALLLWRISRLDLQLLPIHPDKMGGLSFLGLSQTAFGLVGFAGGCVVSSALTNNMVYRGASLDASVTYMVVYVALAVLVNIAPVLVFTPKLIHARAHGLFGYDALGQEYATLFDQKWVKGMKPEGESVLGSSDIQSLADLSNSLSIVQNMSIIPVDRKTAILLTATAAVPIIPLLLAVLPVSKIVMNVLGLRS